MEPGKGLPPEPYREGRTGCKTEERSSCPGFPLVHGEAQSAACQDRAIHSPPEAGG